MMEVENQKFKELAATFRAITESFRTFTCEIIGLKNAQFQKELDDILSLEYNRKIAITLPRGHGKSTHLAVAYPLWEIAKNHNVRILLVSNTAEISKTSLSAIKNNVEKNERYKHWAQAIDPKVKGVLPQLRPKHKREEHWSADAITITRDNIQIKDPSVVAVGLFGSILSRRADIIICDDICNQENSATEEQRAKVVDWVYTTLLPVLVPGGRFIYIGNTWHADDLMSQMLKDPQFDIRKRTPAIIHESVYSDLWNEWANICLDEALPATEKKIKADAFYILNKTKMDQGVEILWPERFSYADLYLQRIANPYSFARMFQCDPASNPNQLFSEEDINKALEKGKDLILQNALRTEYDTDFTVSGLDLAISQRGDDTALLSIDRVKNGSGLIKAGDIVIRNIERGKFKPNQTIEIVKRHDAIIRPSAIRVESNGFQEALSRDIGDYNIPVRSYHTGGEKNDPDIGVNSLAVLFSQGRIILPFSNKDARTRQFITLLVNELRAYPEGHTGDALMALWFAYSELRDQMAGRVLIPAGSYSQPTKGPLNETDADREIINKQELARGGYDSALSAKQFETLEQRKKEIEEAERMCEQAGEEYKEGKGMFSQEKSFAWQDVVRDVKNGYPLSWAMRHIRAVEEMEKKFMHEQEEYKKSGSLENIKKFFKQNDDKNKIQESNTETDADDLRNLFYKKKD